MEEQNNTTQNNMNMNVNSEGSADVMSTKDWVFTLLMLLIPIANLVFAIMWAIGGEKVNQNKRNFFRAYWIVGLSATAIMFLLMLVLGSTLFTAMLRIANNGIVNEHTEMENDIIESEYPEDDYYNFDSDDYEGMNEDDIFGDDNITEENYDDEFSALNESEESVGGYYYDGTETYTVGDSTSGYLELPTYFTENTDISYTDFEGVMDVKQWYSGDDTVTIFTYLSSVSAAETQKSVVELIKKITAAEHGEIAIQDLGSNTIGLNDEYVCECTEAYYDDSGEDYEASNWVFFGSDGFLRLITICHPTSSDENYWYFVGTYHE